MITPREGSTLYYCLLWTPPAARQRFIERLNLIQSLSRTLEDVQEPQVAEHKIHWWHEEVQRLIDGKARHPAAQAVQASLAGNDIALQHCLSILSAASTSRFTPAASDSDADQLLIQSHSARLALLAEALSAEPMELDTSIHSAELALALGKHEQLSRLPQLLHRGHPVFSNETYQRFSINPRELATHILVDTQAHQNAEVSDLATELQTSPVANALKSIAVVVDNPARQVMLKTVIEQTRQDFTRATQNPAISEHYRRKPLLPLWRLLILREKQLALWQRDPPDLLRERTTLTPLHKLFWAWRNQR